MFCNNCGAEIAESAVFCTACGAPVQQAAAPKTKKKSRARLIIALVAIVVVIAGVVVFLILYNTPVRRYERQVDLGDRYLSELQYEDAIAAYEAALQIDPKSVSPYEELADIYIETRNEAALYDLYVRASANLDASQIAPLRATATQAVKGYLDDLSASGDVEGMVALAEKWQPLLNDGAIAALLADGKAQMEVKAERDALLSKVYEALSAHDYQGMMTIDSSGEAETVIAGMEGDHILWAPEGVGENFTGTAAGIYRYRRGNPNYYFYYYGELQDGLCSGQGISCIIIYNGYTPVEVETYEGTWAADMPNGHGAQIEHEYSGGRYHTITEEGTYKDGLQHGTFTWKEAEEYVGKWESRNGEAPMVDVEAVRNGEDSWAYDMYLKPRALDNNRIAYNLGFYDYDGGRGVLFLTYDPATEYLGVAGFRDK